MNSEHQNENQKESHNPQQHLEHRSSPHGGGSLSAMYHAVMRGGELQAMGRMGIDELSQALKAFPDSIHAHAEPGGMFEPLHSDIAADRDHHASSLHSREEGGVHGKEVQTAENEKPISWVERVFGRPKPNDSNDQNNLPRGKTLPDDQLENDKGRDR